MIKRINVFLILIITLFMQNVYAKENLYYTNEETNYQVVYDDSANLLSEEEKNKLLNDMKPLTQFGNIGFISINENNSGSTSKYASDTYHSLFGTKSGTIFLIDMKYRNIYIFSDGSNNTIINRNKALIITDNIYKYATNKAYYECAKEAFDEMHTLLKGGKILEPMRHTSNYIISLVISAFITFFIAIKITKIKKAKTKDILSNSINSFDAKVTDMLKTGEHTVYSPRDSGGSSGGSSGGGSSGGGGGGSSGSGGGHSF